MQFTIAVHGGAGTILKQDMTAAFEKKYKQGLQLALITGYAILEKGGTATDAVIAATVVLEDDILLMQAAVLYLQKQACMKWMRRL